MTNQTSLMDLIGLDKAISMTAAAKRMRGRGGRSPSVVTVRRWANPKRGCYPQGRDGPQLLLMTVRYNGELLTLPDWVEAFERERLRLGQRQPAHLSRSTPKREAAQRRAETRLDKDGVGGKQQPRGSN